MIQQPQKKNRQWAKRLCMYVYTYTCSTYIIYTNEMWSIYQREVGKIRKMKKSNCREDSYNKHAATAQTKESRFKYMCTHRSIYITNTKITTVFVLFLPGVCEHNECGTNSKWNLLSADQIRCYSFRNLFSLLFFNLNGLFFIWMEILSPENLLRRCGYFFISFRYEIPVTSIKISWFCRFFKFFFFSKEEYEKYLFHGFQFLFPKKRRILTMFDENCTLPYCSDFLLFLG